MAGDPRRRAADPVPGHRAHRRGAPGATGGRAGPAPPAPRPPRSSPPSRPLRPPPQRSNNLQGLSLVVLLLIVLFALVAVIRAVRVIQQGFVGVVKRLGQFAGTRQPGVVFLVPFVDTMETVDMRETPRTGDRQDVITRDNVSVAVNATIFSQVVDAQMALFSVSNYLVAIDQLSRTTLRAVFGGMTLDDALSQREQINTQLQAQ